MNLKKVIAATLVSGTIVSLASQIAHAATVSYNFRLPATGTRYTATTTKKYNYENAYNNVTWTEVDVEGTYNPDY